MTLRTLLLALLLSDNDFVALYKQALHERAESLGATHPKTAQSARDLGLYLKYRGLKEEAAQYLNQALEIAEKNYPPTDPRIAAALEEVASVSPPPIGLGHYRRAIEIRSQYGESVDLAHAMERAADLLDGKSAEALYRKALAILIAKGHAGDARTANVLNSLALSIQESSPNEAEAFFRRALQVNEAKLGKTHPEIGTTMNNLASLLLARGRLQQAEPLQRRALVVLENALGRDHPRVAVALSNLGDILRAKGLLDQAEKLYLRTLDIDEKAYGPAHPEVAADLENLASLSDERGRPADARAYRDRAQSIRAR